MPPPFLDGPLAVLLTNFGGFSAHLDAQTGSQSARDGSLTGELLGRGTKFLFAPGRNEPQEKHAPAGGFSFIWDAGSASGYVLSEALQGYAPVSTRVRATNVIVRAARTAPQSLDGHRTESEEVTVELSDGSTNSFQIWRAANLKGFPTRIDSATALNVRTLTFSKVRFELPPEDLFTPPSDFTKYTSPEALADELFIRHRNLHRKTGESALPPGPPGPPGR